MGSEDLYKIQDFQCPSSLSSSSLSLSLTHVNYSCGSCGYQLNLNSCNRNTPAIGAKYKKSIKKATISFFSIDETRFSQIEEALLTSLPCIPGVCSGEETLHPIPSDFHIRFRV